EGDPLALHGVRDHDDRARGPWPPERVQQLRMIMAVDFADLPAEACPLVGQRLQLLGLLGAGALLEAVPVDDGEQRGQAVMRSRHGGLPVAAFLELPVSEHHEGTARRRYPARPGRRSRSAPGWRTALPPCGPC